MRFDRRYTSYLLTTILAAGCVGPRADESAVDARPSPAVVIDGSFDDWQRVGNAADDVGDAPDAEVDLGPIRIQHDAEFVHVMFGLGREVNVQRLDGSLEMLLDTDGDSNTGAERHGMPGVDVVIQFTPENASDPDRPGMGVGVTSTSYAPDPEDESAAISHAHLDIILAPTYATGTIECRVRRAASLPHTPPLFTGHAFALRLVSLGRDGRVADKTDVVSHALTSVAANTVKPFAGTFLPSRIADGLRVMTWNVAFGTLLKKPDAPGRILRAVDPDVLLLQEMTDEDSAAAIQSFLDQRVSRPGASWHVLFGQGGGPLRCAIASRFPIEAVPSLAMVAYPDRPDRQVRTVGGIITIGDRRLLVASIHLTCCGRINSREDESRRVEVDLIHRAIEAARVEAPFDAAVIGGDLNLVGGYEPLRRLQAGLDVDGTDLTILEAYQLDARSNATWANPAESFVPGRLDYLLISDSTLEAAGSFVFDSADIAARRLAKLSLRPSDSATASDHFPIVTDLIWHE